MCRRCNCMRRCHVANCPKYTEDMLEEKCQDVQNTNNECNNMCECGFDEEESVFPENPMLAQSYVPWQVMDKTFKPCIGLKMGTIFPELVSPYVPCQSIEEINYIRNANEIGEGCNKC